MSKKISLAEYLRLLLKRAHGTPDLLRGHKDWTPRVPKLANFLREHDLVGTLRGSPLWRRNAKFYERNAKV